MKISYLSLSKSVKTQFSLTVTFSMLFISFFILIFTSSINGQPSPSNPIGTGSKFDVFIEQQFLSEDVTKFQTAQGEVELFQNPATTLLEFRGFGHGILKDHEAAGRTCESEIDISGNIKWLIFGTLQDDGMGGTVVYVNAVPISSANIAKGLASFDANTMYFMLGEQDTEENSLPGPSDCPGFSKERPFPWFDHNESKMLLKDGSINAEETYGTGPGKFIRKTIVTPPALKYDISGTVKDDNGRPISNSKVVMIDAEELKEKFGNNFPPSTGLRLSDLQLPFEQKTATSDDKNAKYSFTIDGKGKVLPTMLVVSLLWYDKEKGGGGEFAVTTGPENKGRKIPIYLVSCVSNLYPGECHPWKPNKAKDGFEAEVNFVYGDNSLHSLFSLVTNEDLYPRTPFWGTLAGDAAYIYYNSYRAIKYFESLKGSVSMTQNPVTIDVYNSIDKDCLDKKTKADRDNAFYSDRQVLNIGGLGKNLEPVQSKGGTITICKLTSNSSISDAPMNREYHEFGHYFQRDIYYPVVPWQPGRGIPHAGYENSGTNDSVVEGFASFVALLITEHSQGGTKSKFVPLYPGGPGSIDMDVDFQVWGDHVTVTKDSSGKFKFSYRPNDGSPDDEEEAIDGILWDLHDNTKDSHSGLSTVYPNSIDEITIPGPDILQMISKTKPMNLLQLYNAWEAQLPRESVDMIFVNHGAFGDNIDRNLKQDLGELPGFTGDTRTNPDRTHRTKVPTIPGSFITAENDATFNISMIHEPPNGDYDFSFLDNMTKGELTYFRMSPSYYPSKAVFDQVSSDGNKTLADNILVIDSDEYWNYIHSTPGNNSIFKKVPVPVAVPSFPVEQVNTLNMTDLNRGNGTFNENNTLTNQTMQNNVNSLPNNNTNIGNSTTNFNFTLPPTIPLTNNNVPPSPGILQAGVPNKTETIYENLTTSFVPLPAGNTNGSKISIQNASRNSSTYITIKMLPDSSPLFYKCNETPENSSATLPGLNFTASAIQAITDGDPNTHILGSAVFDIIFQKPLADLPGADLTINEAGADSESYGIAVLSGDNSTSGTVNFVGTPSDKSDSCGNKLNTYQLDFTNLMHEGNTISGLRINIDPDNNGGADISDITLAPKVYPPTSLTNNSIPTPSASIQAGVPNKTETIYENLTSPIPLPASNGSLTVGISSPNSNGTYVTVQLLPDSSPLFFKCNETSVNGESTLPGLNASASTTQAITDGNPNTEILGKAVFDIKFEQPLQDRPGPDLIVYEAGDGEPYKIAASSNDSQFSDFKEYRGNSTGTSDDCGYDINVVKIDLNDLLSPLQNITVSSVRIDNEGAADISDITTVNFGGLLTHR